MENLLRLLKADELAERLQVSRYKAYELLRNGDIPAVLIGRLVRCREEDVRAFIEARRTNGEKP